MKRQKSILIMLLSLTTFSCSNSNHEVTSPDTDTPEQRKIDSIEMANALLEEEKEFEKLKIDCVFNTSTYTFTPKGDPQKKSGRD